MLFRLPTYEYSKEFSGKWVTQSVDFPIEDIYDVLMVTLQASTDIVNQDVRRDMNMNVYHIMSDFMTKSAGMVQAIVAPQTPSDFKKYLISQYGVGVSLLQKILRDFDQPDTEKLVPELDEIINLEKAKATSIDLMQQGQPPTGGQPPQGAPPQRQQPMPPIQPIGAPQ